jgi:hypothetical protein
MYVVLVQYLHLVTCVVASSFVIPSSVVLNLAPQEVPPPIQDEHGNAMEDSEWAHKGSRWCCKVDPCTSSMWPNGCSINTWNKHIPFECKLGDRGVHLFILGGLGNKIMVLWMLIFWATHMQGKSGMRRRLLIEWRRKQN